MQHHHVTSQQSFWGRGLKASDWLRPTVQRHAVSGVRLLGDSDVWNDPKHTASHGLASADDCIEEACEHLDSAWVISQQPFWG